MLYANSERVHITLELHRNVTLVSVLSHHKYGRFSTALNFFASNVGLGMSTQNFFKKLSLKLYFNSLSSPFPICTTSHLTLEFLLHIMLDIAFFTWIKALIISTLAILASK